MAYEIHKNDRLRSPERICEADSRTHLYKIREDNGTGGFRQREIEDQYEAIACFRLNETVPENVVIHFETAKNLFLYSWFVYRFYSVAEQQAIASLEFALRERFPDYVIAHKNEHPRKMEPGLKKLLGHAINSGLVTNNQLLARERWAKSRAKSRYSDQKRQEAKGAGLDQWEEDESEIEVTQDDLDYDWLRDLKEIIPKIRNDYAHGSWRLYPPSVLHAFDVVTEIINQIYPE
jgi:hypothetical protein